MLLNFVTVWVALFLRADIQAVGIGLAALNVPLLGYVWGETKRPSNEDSSNIK